LQSWAGSKIGEEFTLSELTEIMRKKEAPFDIALNVPQHKPNCVRKVLSSVLLKSSWQQWLVNPPQ
jgi:hypothetical protein